MTRTNVMSVEPCSSVRILTGISEQENRVFITQSPCKHHQSTLNHDQKLLLFLVCKFFYCYSTYSFFRNISKNVKDQQGKQEEKRGGKGGGGNGIGNEYLLVAVAVLSALWLLKVVADANRYVLVTYKQFENLMREKKVRLFKCLLILFQNNYIPMYIYDLIVFRGII